MEDDKEFTRPRLVVGNRTEPLCSRTAASRKRRLMTVFLEWNESTEWWVGQVHADAEVYRVGSFASVEQAFAATLRYYYEVATDIQREKRLEAERAAIAAAVPVESSASNRVDAPAPPVRRKRRKDTDRREMKQEGS